MTVQSYQKELVEDNGCLSYRNPIILAVQMHFWQSETIFPRLYRLLPWFESCLFSNHCDLWIPVYLVTIIFYVSGTYHFLSLNYHELFHKLYLKKDDLNKWVATKTKASFSALVLFCYSYVKCVCYIYTLSIYKVYIYMHMIYIYIYTHDIYIYHVCTCISLCILLSVCVYICVSLCHSALLSVRVSYSYASMQLIIYVPEKSFNVSVAPWTRTGQNGTFICRAHSLTEIWGKGCLGRVGKRSSPKENACSLRVMPNPEGKRQ